MSKIVKILRMAMNDAALASGEKLANKYEPLIKLACPDRWEQFQEATISGLEAVEETIRKICPIKGLILEPKIDLAMAAARDMNASVQREGSKLAMEYREVIEQYNPKAWEQYKDGLITGYEVVYNTIDLLTESRHIPVVTH